MSIPFVYFCLCNTQFLTCDIWHMMHNLCRVIAQFLQKPWKNEAIVVLGKFVWGFPASLWWRNETFWNWSILHSTKLLYTFPSSRKREHSWIYPHFSLVTFHFWSHFSCWHFSFNDNSVLVTLQLWGHFKVTFKFQFWWYFRYADILVSVIFPFWWHFSFGDISILVTFLL